MAAVLRDLDDQILLHRRRVGWGWAPPSGTVEPGETLLGALRRELLEETSLPVEVERLVAVYSDPAYHVVHYPDGRHVHFVACVFACRTHHPDELVGSDEGLEWAWFAPDRLPSELVPYARIWLRDALADADRVIIN